MKAPTLIQSRLITDAANWHFVGQTTGRTRNGSSQPIAPVKDVYVYPLHSQARVMLQ